MQTSLLKGIVRITAGGARGTGFVARGGKLLAEGAANPGGEDDDAPLVVVTALHVLADRERSRAAGVPQYRSPQAKLRFRGGAVVDIDLPANVLHASVDEDWVVISLPSAVPAGVGYLRMADLETRSCERRWSTFGYSDASPDAGEPHSGRIELADEDVICLFSDQAAAGVGGVATGLSGGPCVFEGHVVGVMLEALHNRRNETVHGALYALPIGKISTACGIPLAPGEQVFEPEVESALTNVHGASLERLALALDVPPMDSETALRRWTARALLLAEFSQVQEALAGCVHGVREPESVVAMALTRAIREDGAAAVRRSWKTGAPRGVATVATETLTMQLLVARAVGAWELMKRRLSFVDSRERSRENWATRVREALVGVLGFSLEEIDVADEAVIRQAIADYGGAFMLAFQFDARPDLCAEIERFSDVRALPMLSPEHAATFAREGYEVAPALDNSNSEAAINKARATAARYLAPRRIG